MKFRLTAVCALLSAALLAGGIFTSCEKDRFETKGFALYYSGMTDIGPSMSGVISTPTYKGGVPSEFTITKVTLDGAQWDGSIFSINAETGAINIASTKDTPTGTYSISVSCKVGGSVHNFPDVVEVTFLSAVPESVKVDPSSITVKYAAVIGLDPDAELPEAAVVTEGEHISISGYVISNVRYNGVLSPDSKQLFSISDTGVITINTNSNFQPGVYSLDIKLNTAISGSDSQDGIFENALTVNVISEPLSLTYSPNPARMEEETGDSRTSFTSAAPAFVGSTEEIAYSIAEVVPSTDKFSIDASTGVISVKEGHGFKNGESYAVSVKVANKYAPDGVLFGNVLSLNVISYIEPVSGFSYSNAEAVQALGFSITPDASLKGDDIRFSLVEIADADKDYISFDETTGIISASKGNSLALGDHRFTVKAVNDKNEQTAQVALTIVANPNWFTYFSYGNNLGLTEDQTSGVSQFRAASASDLTAMSLAVKYSDIPEGASVKWSLATKAQMGGTTIDEDGTIHPKGYTKSQTGVVFVTATIGEGETAVSVTVPVFFSFTVPITPKDGTSEVTIEYNPFVLRVNPRTGGKLPSPSISGADANSFYMDFRRTFNWFNLSGVRSDGTEHESGTLSTTNGLFLQAMWTYWAEATKKNKNFGSKDPVSYFSNQSNLSSALLYVDNSDGADRFSVVVNPGKWNDDGWADGVFTGQVTVSTATSAINNGTQIFPVAVWFDKDFE